MSSTNNISKLEKVLILAKLVEKYCEESDFLSCIKLAKDLLRTIEELEYANISFDKLAEEFFDFFPEHWKKRTQFLLIVTKYWPEILNEQKIKLERISPNKTQNISTNFNLIFQNQISLVETNTIYDEIDYIVELLKLYNNKSISIVSPNPDFSTYLIQRLKIQSFDFSSYVSNENISEEFIASLRNNFKELNDVDFNKIVRELSDLEKTERKASNISIINISDIPSIQSEILIYTELNDKYWAIQDSGSFWLHSSFRKKLGLIQNNFEDLFYLGITKSPISYLIRSLKENGQNTRKCSFLSKFQAILQKEGRELKIIKKARSSANEVFQNNQLPINLFKFPYEISSKSIELLLKDPYAFFAKETLNLKPEDRNEHKDLTIAFRNLVKAYFSNLPIDPWLNFIKETDFFGYQKSLNLLDFLEKSSKYANSQNNIFGKFKISEFDISIYGYCDRVIESDYTTLINYQTKTSPDSTKDILYGNSTNILTTCLIAEKGCFKEIKKPIRKIEIWNILANNEDQIMTKEIEISKEIVSEFEMRLTSDLRRYFKSSNENSTAVSKQTYDKYKHFKRM